MPPANCINFNPVFKGIPAEVVTGGFPFTMATAPLSSPVYDEGSGLVIASAAFSTTNNGGRVHTLCATVTVPSCGTVGTTSVATGILGPSTAGLTCQTPGAGATSGSGANLFLDAPIVDPSNKTIYVVIGNDSTGSSALYEFPEAYTANSCGTEIKLGTGSTFEPRRTRLHGRLRQLLVLCRRRGSFLRLWQYRRRSYAISSYRLRSGHHFRHRECFGCPYHCCDHVWSGRGVQ